MAHSEEKRKAIMDMAKSEKLTDTTLCEVYGISRRTLWEWKQLEKETGSLAHKTSSGRKKSHSISLEQFEKVIIANPDKNLHEIGQLFDPPVSQYIAGRLMKNIGYTFKKKTFGYQERNEHAREEFIEEIKNVPPEQLVYMDEAGILPDSPIEKGWSRCNTRCHAMKPGKRLPRINIIAALCDKHIIAPLVRIGKTTSEVVENWIEKELIPHLKVGQILILDNAAFHRKQIITALLEKVGCMARFLPTYSPDLNQIEHYWSGIKRKIRKGWKAKSPEQSHLESAQNTFPLVC